MSVSISVTEVVRNFAEYVNRVAYRRESFVLMRGSRAVASLTPVPQGRPLRELPVIMEMLPRLDPDDAADFERDLTRAAAELDAQGVDDHWES